MRVPTLGIQLRPAVVRVAGILDSHGTDSSKPSPCADAPSGSTRVETATHVFGICVLAMLCCVVICSMHQPTQQIGASKTQH